MQPRCYMIQFSGVGMLLAATATPSCICQDTAGGAATTYIHCPCAVGFGGLGINLFNRVSTCSIGTRQDSFVVGRDNRYSLSTRRSRIEETRQSYNHHWSQYGRHIGMV